MFQVNSQTTKLQYRMKVEGVALIIWVGQLLQCPGPRQNAWHASLQHDVYLFVRKQFFLLYNEADGHVVLLCEIGTLIEVKEGKHSFLTAHVHSLLQASLLRKRLVWGGLINVNTADCFWGCQKRVEKPYSCVHRSCWLMKGFGSPGKEKCENLTVRHSSIFQCRLLLWGHWASKKEVKVNDYISR